MSYQKFFCVDVFACCEKLGKKSSQFMTKFLIFPWIKKEIYFKMIRIQSHQSNILNCPECCTPVYRPMFKTHMLNSHKNVIESKWIRCPKCPSYLPTYFKRRQHLMIEHDYFQCEVCFMEYQTFPGILFVYILFFRCLFNLDIIKFSFFWNPIYSGPEFKWFSHKK